MKDVRQGAAAIVFLIFYACALTFILYCLFTRRGKRYITSISIFATLRLGANISTLGWAINLYDNFNWLIASLILGAEGKSRRGHRLTYRLLRPDPRHPILHCGLREGDAGPVDLLPRQTRWPEQIPAPHDPCWLLVRVQCVVVSLADTGPEGHADL
jgi:hypothetical protein